MRHRHAIETALLAPKSERERRGYNRILAICKDCLGQAYQDKEPEKAKRYFRQAIKLNREAGHENGVLRARCHLTVLNFRVEENFRSRQAHMEQFAGLLQQLLSEPSEQRGLGVRWKQYAKMLADLGRYDEALDSAKCGERIANLFSDARTEANTLILQAEFIMQSGASGDSSDAQAISTSSPGENYS